MNRDILDNRPVRKGTLCKDCLDPQAPENPELTLTDPPLPTFTGHCFLKGRKTTHITNIP